MVIDAGAPSSQRSSQRESCDPHPNVTHQIAWDHNGIITNRTPPSFPLPLFLLEAHPLSFFCHPKLPATTSSAVTVAVQLHQIEHVCPTNLSDLALAVH